MMSDNRGKSKVVKNGVSVPLMSTKLKGLKSSVPYIPTKRFCEGTRLRAAASAKQVHGAADFVSGTDRTRTGMLLTFVIDLPESPQTMGRSPSIKCIRQKRPLHTGELSSRILIDASAGESYPSSKGMPHLNQADTPFILYYYLSFSKEGL